MTKQIVINEGNTRGNVKNGINKTNQPAQNVKPSVAPPAPQPKPKPKE